MTSRMVKNDYHAVTLRVVVRTAHPGRDAIDDPLDCKIDELLFTLDRVPGVVEASWQDVKYLETLEEEE